MLAARSRAGIAHHFVATGQHDRMVRAAFAAFGLTIDHDLALLVPGDTIAQLAGRIAAAMPALIARFRPDLLLVQGDTTSAWAAALAAHRHGIAVGHIEAGLRSGDMDLPWPEERNRVEIDAVSDLLFAPTQDACRNLAAEPAVRGEVHLTGNTGIDALLQVPRVDGPLPRRRGKRLVLVTIHRREAIGEPLRAVCAAIAKLARRGDVHIVMPVHPNPAIGGAIRTALSGTEHVSLIAPLDYPEMIAMMRDAFLILSDSGGLQEEAPALGVPLLALRSNSERPEAIATGNVRLIGTDTAAIVRETEALLDDPLRHAAMSIPAFPFGRGDAAIRILDAIERWWALRMTQAGR